MDPWKRHVADLLNDWWQSVEKLTEKIITTIKTESRKRGIDEKYVIFTLMEHPRSLDTLRVDAEVLKILLMVWKSHPTFSPKFTGAQSPDIDDEDKVDDILVSLTQWAEKVWLPSLAISLKRLTAQRASQSIRLWEEDSGHKVVKSDMERLVWEWMRAFTLTHLFSGPAWPADMLFDMLGVDRVRY